jgi:hypothetical protein
MKKQFGLILFFGLMFLVIGCRQDSPNSDVANYYATVTRMSQSWNNPTSVPTPTATATATPEPTSAPEAAMTISATTSEWKEYLDQVELETPWQVFEQTECAFYYYNQTHFSTVGNRWNSAGLTWCEQSNSEWFVVRLNGIDSMLVRQGTVVNLGIGYLTVLNNEVKVYNYDRSIACLSFTPWIDGWDVSVYGCDPYFLNGEQVEQEYELLRNLELYYVE